MAENQMNQGTINRGQSTANKIWKLVTKQKAVVAILLLLIIMVIAKERALFYNSRNLLGILRSTAVVEIVAFGVSIAVICGGCDLSCGGVLSLSGIVAILAMNAGLPIPVAIVLALVCGALIGFINGFLVVHQKTEPFIITLGMGMLLKGVAQELTNAHPLACTNESFQIISNSNFLSVPSLVVYMVVLMIAFYCLLRFTSYGRNCYAIGGNYDVAKYSGIPVVPIKWSAFVISGTTAALAGVLLASRMNTGNSVYGDGTGMLVNCGCVIGGTSFAGGQGGIVQSFIGLLVLQLVDNVLSTLPVDPYIKKILTGALIVAIIASDCFGRKLKRERV